jgi:broad specificity phosphatase PhoE
VTTVLLVRHAEHAQQNRVLVGRNDDVPLSRTGCRQLKPLSDALARLSVAAVHSSPRRRARETAQSIAAPHRLPVETFDALDEIDYGAWTGLGFNVLDQRSDWRAWNTMRARASPPMGESMQALQERMLDYLGGLCRTYPGESVVVVSHAEPIRAAILHTMQLALNDFLRIEISPASITRLRAVERAVPQWKVSSA